MSTEIEIVGYLRASPEGKPEWSEDCVCVDAVYPNYDGDESVSMPICRAADAKVIIDQLRTELAALKAGKGEAVAYIRAADLDRLAPRSVSGCAASLSKEPFDGFIAIYTAPPAPSVQCTHPDCGCADSYCVAPPASAEARLVPVELLMRLTKRVMLRSQEEAHADACDELRVLLVQSNGVKP